MWFRFPEGVTEINCQQQSFVTEITDTNGRGYFRAPNHFSSIILGIKGFRVAEPPAGAPEDLPLPDPLRDGAIEDLARKNAALEAETSNMRTDMSAMAA